MVTMLERVAEDSPTSSVLATSTEHPTCRSAIDATVDVAGSSGLPRAASQDDSNLLNRDFIPLAISILSESQKEMDFMDSLTFSNRGSVLLAGEKAVDVDGSSNATPSAGTHSDPSLTLINGKEMSQLLSPDLQHESLKVRSMYEAETSLLWEDGAPSSLQASKSSSALIAEHLQPLTLNLASHSLSSLKASSDSIPLASDQREGLSSPRSASELAGGIEDWEDVNYGQTDRYGFIISRPSISNQVTSGSPARSSPVMSQSAAETSRQRKVLSKSISSTQKAQPSGRLPQVAIRKTSTKSLRTQGTSRSESGPAKSLRAARSRLPGNQHRRWMDEAGDMLTLQPGLADIVEENDNEHANPSVTTKELERIKKWSKMARSREVKGGDVVGWGAYHFDTMNAKLVERTWKGIPDCWRAAAWHSFLSASARRVKGSKTDTEIIAAFYDLLPQSSADDVQIDLDVPRTINSHIMFRKRYRGGQRLLFRVLHCVSLYFPETRYVQGMASLAATLLCYYAEETCFVMLVRMWTLRGLEKLYAPGFAGLFAALDEFSRDWMKGHDVCQSLERQGIDPTAYGTRWYLTLFNYSIPFAAQLRVWDVFMLLGDENPSLKVTAERPFAGALDVLHAASCALIDGTREILLDSDFENSMKVLTSWVPIKDEELFMKVAKVEWRLNHKKKDR